jgi:HEAT repeat protein
MNAVNMLIMQKRFAQTARPEILQLTNDPDANVRGGAAFALRFVFPDNATPAPAKGGSSADESQPGQRK